MLYRDGEAARATFAHEGDNTRVGAEPEKRSTFLGLRPELSPRFRAAGKMVMLKGVRIARALDEAIEK